MIDDADRPRWVPHPAASPARRDRVLAAGAALLAIGIGLALALAIGGAFGLVP